MIRLLLFSQDFGDHITSEWYKVVIKGNKIYFNEKVSFDNNTTINIKNNEFTWNYYNIEKTIITIFEALDKGLTEL